MKGLLHKALLQLGLLALLAFCGSIGAFAQTAVYTLLDSASASGPSVFVQSGSYQLSLVGTFGGTSVSLVETQNSGGATHTLGTWTSAPSEPPCVTIPYGVQVQMVVTGGSPSGLIAVLGGTAGVSCPAAGGSGGDASGAKQDIGNASLDNIDTSTAAVAAASANAGSDGSKALAVQGVTGGKPVSIAAGSLPLPAGASTAAKQPALGTAGSPSADVISMQGVASGTPVAMSASALPLPAGAATSALQPTNAAQGSTTSGQTGPLAQAAVTTSAPSYTNAQTSPLNQDTSGNLRVKDANSVALLAAAQSGTSNTGSAVPASAIYPGMNVGGNLTGLTGTANGLKVDGSAVTQPVNGADPCFATAKLTADFESTSSGGSIITASSGKKVYICSIAVVPSAAANFSLIEGTGSSVCTGGTTAGVFMNPGVTAANGAAISANGGFFGSGNSTVAQSGTANQNVCVVFTTTNSPQVNVHLAYVSAP